MGRPLDLRSADYPVLKAKGITISKVRKFCFCKYCVNTLKTVGYNHQRLQIYTGSDRRHYCLHSRSFTLLREISVNRTDNFLFISSWGIG